MADEFPNPARREEGGGDAADEQRQEPVMPDHGKSL